MISWPLLSLIIIADLSLISGALLYLLHLPGYNRTMYMEGIGIQKQRSIKMRLYVKFITIFGVILGMFFLLVILIGATVTDPNTIRKERLPDTARVFEMGSTTPVSFVIMTERCVWIYKNDELNETGLALRVISRNQEYYREPQLMLINANNFFGGSNISNGLVLVLRNPDEQHQIAEPILNIQTE